ncbi:MAG: hypothetical protein AB4060_22905 [Crocosphaera sp.]
MIRNGENINICLTTLAIGSEYRQLAQLLAQDALEICGDTTFVILTDKPKDFVKYKNVLAIKHQVKSVGVYHDKLFALKESLKDFECSIFLDSDCRLFKNVVESRPWKKGLTVKSCHNLLNFVTRYQRKNEIDFNKNKQYRIISYVADKYLINPENCKFVQEILFVLRKDELKAYENFLNVWDEIRVLFEGNEVFNAEGITIGLAAHISKLNIYHYNSGYLDVECRQNIDYIYKDRLFKRRKDISPEIAKKEQEFTKQRQGIAKKFYWFNKLNKPLKKFKMERRMKKLNQQFSIVKL